MNYNYFGELLKEIRTSNNFTLQELAKGICSVRQLSRIEKGENDPSLYLLHNFSQKLNIDLQEYYKIISTSQSFEADKLKYQLMELIKSGDLHKIREYIVKIEKKDEFLEGENLQHIFYGKALCITHLDKDYMLSNKYCYKGLRIEEPSFNISEIKDNFYSNVGLTMINLIASNFEKIGNKDTSYQITQDLFSIVDNYISNIPFPMYRSLNFLIKLYQGLSCNLSILSMGKKEYNISLKYVNKGISFSIQENYMRFLPELLAQKSRLLFEMDLIDESLECYNNCLSFYKILRSERDAKNIELEIKDKFKNNRINEYFYS